MNRAAHLVVIWLVATVVFAADVWGADGTPVRVGFEAGMGVSRYVGADVSPNLISRTGLTMGGFVSLRPLAVLGIQSEVLWVQKGSGEGRPMSDAKRIEQLDYLEIPIMVELSPITKGRIRPSVFAGPYVDFKLNTGLKLVPPQSSSGIQEGIAGDKVRRTSMGLAFGGKLGLELGRGELFVSGRYELGLSKTWDFSPNPTEDLKDNSIILLAGYSFRIH
jgi:hypothetical protein